MLPSLVEVSRVDVMMAEVVPVGSGTSVTVVASVVGVTGDEVSSFLFEDVEICTSEAVDSGSDSVTWVDGSGGGDSPGQL
jgi:hypothetical protein